MTLMMVETKTKGCTIILFETMTATITVLLGVVVNDYDDGVVAVTVVETKPTGMIICLLF